VDSVSRVLKSRVIATSSAGAVPLNITAWCATLFTNTNTHFQFNNATADSHTATADSHTATADSHTATSIPANSKSLSHRKRHELKNKTKQRKERYFAASKVSLFCCKELTEQ